MMILFNRILKLLIFIQLISCKPDAPSPKQYKIILPKIVKFQTGDSLLWAKNSYNDANWEDISLGESWSTQGCPDYEGVAWYRIKFTIPSVIKESLYFKNNDTLTLYLGKVSHADETFFNGKRIGKMGSINPYIEEKKQRVYKVNKDIIKWDEENVLAVRVKSLGDKYGLVKALYILETKQLRHFSNIEISTSKESGLFYGEDSMDVSFFLSLDTANPFDLNSNIICKVLPDTYNPKKVYGQFNKTFIVQRGDSNVVTFKYKPNKPGFYKFYFMIYDGRDTLYEKMYRLGYEPENIDYELTRRPDFEEYWDSARRELANVVPEFSLQKIDSLCDETSNVYLVEMKSLGDITIKGWYTVPVEGANNPGLLEVPFYGGALPPRISEDFCVFSLHTRGHGMSAEEINPGFPEYYQNRVEDKYQYIYRGAYMDCIRAVDFLYSRKEVDTSKIAVYGISQGGALTYATAALDSRIKYAVSRVPGFSNFPLYYRTLEEPVRLFERYRRDHPELSWETIYETLSYIDISNLSPWIKCPMVMTSGLQDNICPSVINFSAYNNIIGEKKVYTYSNEGHGAGGKLPILNMIKEYFECE